MGRRNLFAGRRNGSRAAQIVPESPGREHPTAETTDAAGEGVLETPGALSKPGSLLRRPMRTADPSVLRRNQNQNRSTQVKVAWKKAWAVLGEKENGIGGASQPEGYGKSISELSDTPYSTAVPQSYWRLT